MHLHIVRRVEEDLWVVSKEAQAGVAREAQPIANLAGLMVVVDDPWPHLSADAARAGLLGASNSSAGPP